jgi:hypothetical protein
MVALAVLPASVYGQYQPSAYGPGGNPAALGPRQALFTSPMQNMWRAQTTPYVDAYGNPVVMPAGCCAPCECGYGGCSYGCGPGECGPGGCGPDGCGGSYPPGQHQQFGFTGCYPMGAGGTNPPIGYDMMEDVGTEGYLIDQRGPHYFDVRAEAVYLERDDTFNDDIDFSALNFGQNAVVVLSSSDLDFEAEPGFRVIGRCDICPLSVFEFGYTGIFSFEDSATAVDPNPGAESGNLYSLFSRPAPGQGTFGTDPAGVSDPGGPLAQSERALRHTISIDSDLQTGELTYRRYWVGYTPRVSGTLLAGFRYTRLDEDFHFITNGFPFEDFPDLTPPALDYSIDAENNLAGFQAGGDFWIGLMQGLRIGGEAKAGIYNNHYRLRSQLFSQGFSGFVTNPTPPPPLIEGPEPAISPPDDFRDDQVAFLTEASFDIVADILPSWSIRAGYEVLFLNELVLVGENFNQTSPYGNQGPRVPFLVNDGELFYHGGHAGIEFVW